MFASILGVHLSGAGLNMFGSCYDYVAEVMRFALMKQKLAGLSRDRLSRCCSRVSGFFSSLFF